MHETNPTKNFGFALTSFMEQNHLTQQEVSARTGIAQPVIGRLLKTAQPEMPTIRKIASGLNVDVIVSADGSVTIHQIDYPSDLEITGDINTLNPYQFTVRMFDKLRGSVYTATFGCDSGEDNLYIISSERGSNVPGYVSDYGLLRYAKTFAQQALKDHGHKGIW